MLIRVYVTPGARKQSIEKESDTVFRIKVREPRERNLANTRVKELLAAEFGTTTKQIRIMTGHRSGAKVYDVPSLLLDKT